MSDLDFRKQLIINEFKTMAKGKSLNEMLPLVLAISQKAKQAGITFTKDDMLLIIDQIKDQLSPQELQLLPQIMSLMGLMWKIAPSTHQFLYFMPKKLHKLEVGYQQ